MAFKAAVGEEERDYILFKRGHCARIKAEFPIKNVNKAVREEHIADPYRRRNRF